MKELLCLLATRLTGGSITVQENMDDLDKHKPQRPFVKFHIPCLRLKDKTAQTYPGRRKGTYLLRSMGDKSNLLGQIEFHKNWATRELNGCKWTD